mgnify:CR=1 FL=1
MILFLDIKKKLHYLNTSTKFFKNLNALKFLSLYGFIFLISPLTGLVLISSFFKKDFNPKTMYNDSSLELFIIYDLSLRLTKDQDYRVKKKI